MLNRPTLDHIRKGQHIQAFWGISLNKRITADIMPPKLSKSARQDLILTHLRATGTCHTLKDLEKILPSVASINGIQVKEYIQALTDENQLRVEEIGSGNWYWSFTSDEKHEQERQLARVSAEVEKLRKSCTQVMAALAEETARREREPEDEEEQKALMLQKARLQTAVDRVRMTEAQLTGTRDSLNKGVKQVQAELAGFREDALQWTDNIYVLEEYLRKLGDQQLVEAVLRECYGDEYVDGEGLREL
ncbi:uncharacterized protein N7511_010388 [Penicillium nucicola]|uniref:uncharacterized protein n=1 Tax=Penicillium nucicola TaxID=1850975 RepID=UPI0025455B99|nr:uncharacterized protein N7511_010388 [Penicillium nucicola]KAJ5748692.1 hypothetical protein N7511_010388 [Penicillium nucicola]